MEELCSITVDQVFVKSGRLVGHRRRAKPSGSLVRAAGGDRVALDACDGEAGEGGGWRGGGSKRPPFFVVENPRGFDSLYLLRSSIDQIKLDPGKFSSLRRGERKRWSRDALSRRNEIPFPSLILG